MSPERKVPNRKYSFVHLFIHIMCHIHNSKSQQRISLYIPKKTVSREKPTLASMCKDMSTKLQMNHGPRRESFFFLFRH